MPANRPATAPSPRQEPTTVPSEMITTFQLPLQAGEYLVDLPEDADVFAVGIDREGAPAEAPVLRGWATVTVYDYVTTMNPPRPRTFWVATTGSILPSGRFTKTAYARAYIGTVVTETDVALHVWQIKRRPLLPAELVGGTMTESWPPPWATGDRRYLK